jgi:NADPH-dependent 7-cyano-7-deazaguanine reductase QueF-like protein
MLYATFTKLPKNAMNETNFASLEEIQTPISSELSELLQHTSREFSESWAAKLAHPCA